MQNSPEQKPISYWLRIDYIRGARYDNDEEFSDRLGYSPNSLRLLLGVVKAKQLA
jgi:hypothetical protein